MSGRRVDSFFEESDRQVRALHAADGEQALLEEVGERGGVGGFDLETIGVVSREVVALLDGEEPLEVVEETLLEPGMLEGDVDVSGDGQAHLFVVEQGDEPLDHPVALHLLDALVDRGGREPDRARDLRLRQLAVSLQHVEDPEIDVVDCHPSPPYRIR